MLLAGATFAAAAPACAPTCTVASNAFAFAPALVIVESGATVAWTANDLPNPISHTATSVDRCFHAAYSGNGPGRATFRIAEGVLLAGTPSRAEQPCPDAAPLPDGSFLLEYECIYHAQMTGFVLVRSPTDPSSSDPGRPSL